MPYSINQLAKLAGVTVRTLHHYDDIGLLKPSSRKANAYRQYDQEELLLLQQILFFRELDFALPEIKRMMSAKDFDKQKALLQQRRLLELKRKRLTNLISTLNTTLTHMSKQQPIPADELYNAFEDKDVKQYQEEVKQRWGTTDAYQQSQERMSKMTKSQMEKIKADGIAFTKQLAKQIEKGPEHPDTQKLIDQHYQNLRTFYEPNLELYKGLAEMYVADPRFAKYYNKHHPNLAQFMQDAMLSYVKHRL